MAKLSIVTYPAKILKTKAAEVSRITPALKKLTRQMKEAMYENEGIGLAAPQVGVSKRIIVVETSPDPRKTIQEQGLPRDRPQVILRGKPLVLLNPALSRKSGKQITEEEGCLSLPGIFVPIRRWERVELTGQTPEGVPAKVEAGGLTARIFQHEVDHLNGKLIIDHLSPLKRFKLRRQLKEIAQKTEK